MSIDPTYQISYTLDDEFVSGKNIWPVEYISIIDRFIGDIVGLREVSTPSSDGLPNLPTGA